MDTEEHKLRINLLLSTGWLKNELKAFLDPFEITYQQFNILRILRAAKDELISTNDICERMIDKMSDTSRIVDRLISKSLVDKQPYPNDGRKVQVSLSDEGEYLLSTIDTKLHNLDSSFKSLSKEELAQLNTLLEKLRT